MDFVSGFTHYFFGQTIAIAETVAGVFTITFKIFSFSWDLEFVLHYIGLSTRIVKRMLLFNILYPLRENAQPLNLKIFYLH